MSPRRTVVPFILAGVIPAIAVALLLYLVLRPVPPPVDNTRAPQDLKTLCLSGQIKWRPWSEIIIHHSATDRGNLESFDRYHREKRHWRCAGYHFVIGNGTLSDDGEIELGPRWYTQETGAHCPGHNRTAIGICVVGNFQKKNSQPSEAQMKSLIELTAYLAVRYRIHVNKIAFHDEMAKKPTDCPGKYFPKDAFRRRLAPVLNAYRPAE